MSFVGKFFSKLESLFGPTAAPKWIHLGQSVISFAAPIVVATIAGFDPAVAVVAGPIVTEIQTDLTTAAVLIGDGTATPSLTSALTSVQNNLGALLTAGHVKNPELITQINLVIAETKALVGALPVVVGK